MKTKKQYVPRSASRWTRVGELLLRIILLPACFGCVKDSPMVSLGLEEVYFVPRMKTLALRPEFTGERYRWTLTDPAGRDSVVSETKDYLFLESREGVYGLKFEILDPETPFECKIALHVVHEIVEYNPYIAHVIDFHPAPGQFVNTMPLYEAGDDAEAMRKKAEDCIRGKSAVLVSLGAYGGYITFAFDHTVMNLPGKDFAVFGNAFYSDLPDYENKGGSSEPGIVMVAYDANLNGKPDPDEWYELAGSESDNPETLHGYEIKYHRPDPDKVPVPDMKNSLSDTTYIRWTDSRGRTGYVAKNIFHEQDYYPKWIKADELRFHGTLLPKNAREESGSGRYWVQYVFDWGYVDNKPNDDLDANSFDIAWAVDREGRPVKLKGIDFVRVYSAENQYCGWLGETSTEIVGARDLHIIDPGDILPPAFTGRRSSRRCRVYGARY